MRVHGDRWSVESETVGFSIFFLSNHEKAASVPNIVKYLRCFETVRQLSIPMDMLCRLLCENVLIRVRNIVPLANRHGYASVLAMATCRSCCAPARLIWNICGAIYAEFIDLFPESNIARNHKPSSLLRLHKDWNLDRQLPVPALSHIQSVHNRDYSTPYNPV